MYIMYNCRIIGNKSLDNNSFRCYTVANQISFKAVTDLNENKAIREKNTMKRIICLTLLATMLLFAVCGCAADCNTTVKNGTIEGDITEINGNTITMLLYKTVDIPLAPGLRDDTIELIGGDTTSGSGSISIIGGKKEKTPNDITLTFTVDANTEYKITGSEYKFDQIKVDDHISVTFDADGKVTTVEVLVLNMGIVIK